MNLTISDFKKNSINLIKKFDVVLLYLPKCVRSEIIVNELKKSNLNYGLVDIENNIILTRTLCINLDINVISTPLILVYDGCSFLYTTKSILGITKLK